MFPFHSLEVKSAANDAKIMKVVKSASLPDAEAKYIIGPKEISDYIETRAARRNDDEDD